MQQLENYRKEIKGFSPTQIISWAIKTFPTDKLTLASSLGLEDQVLTQIFLQENPKARIFSLDTGRLFQETYDLMEETSKKYNFSYEILFPKQNSIEKLLKEKGVNSFYKSVENRKECCYIRKIEPLKRVLSTCDAWITGLRSEQSITRTDTQAIEWDESFKIYKINPLINWSEKDCWDFIKKNNIPYNKLHDKNFPSIGCQPCTRAIELGEDIRSGRWWWEQPEQKECGLHLVDGKLVRKKS